MSSHILGNNTSSLVVGVSEIDGVPTPFISAVDPARLGIGNTRLVEGKDGCADMVRRIQDAGGVVIHIHNPDAASNLSSMMAMLFDHAVQGTWGITSYKKETMQ